jgi:hypothetical protein
MLFQHRIPALVVLFLLSWCGLVAGQSMQSTITHSFTLVYNLAHSLQPRALKCLSHPETLALEIIPRQQPGKRNVLSPRSTTLRHSDSFRLIIAAFGDRFFLHLRPNDDLIHPSARINYYHIEDGLQVISHTEVLLRESVKAYWGVVVPEYASAKRMREDAAGVLRGPHGGPELGWAR